ncbi:hypothetical protein RI092_11255 [Lactococcus cremoris]|nr:hypothetical protein [Lactococcus cremoris]MDR9868371.1 hypothetical protein [Lactococcus cremoris]
MSCQKCGKGTIGRYATDNSLCGECSDNSSTTDKLSVDKLQEQLNTAKKALTEIAEIINDDIHECDYSCDNHCELNGSLDMYSVENLKDVTNSALAAIGGDDE